MIARRAMRASVTSLLLIAACTSAGDSTTRASAGRTAPPTTGAPTLGPAAAAIDAAAMSADTDAGTAMTIDAGAAAAAIDARVAATAADYAAVVRAADWARWPGLPPDLRERGLVKDLGLGAVRRTRRDVRLGRHDAVLVEAGDLRYWLRDGDHVVLLEAIGGLGAAKPADLLARLGDSDREAAGRYLQSGATTTEHVYAARGLAVTVAASYATPPAFAPRLAAVQLFALTDLRTFILELGGNDRAGPVH